MHVRARRTARKKRNQFFIGGEILPQSTQAWEISLSTVAIHGFSAENHNEISQARACIFESENAH